MPSRTTWQTAVAALYSKPAPGRNLSTRGFSPAAMVLRPRRRGRDDGSRSRWLKPECSLPGWLEAPPPEATSASAGPLRFRRTWVRTCCTRGHALRSGPFSPGSGSDPERQTGALQTPCTAYRCGFHLASHHLPIDTLEEARKFRSPPVYSGFHRSLRYLEHCGDFPVVHIL